MILAVYLFFTTTCPEESVRSTKSPSFNELLSTYNRVAWWRKPRSQEPLTLQLRQDSWMAGLGNLTSTSTQHLCQAAVFEHPEATPETFCWRNERCTLQENTSLVHAFSVVYRLVNIFFFLKELFWSLGNSGAFSHPAAAPHSPPSHTTVAAIRSIFA